MKKRFSTKLISFFLVLMLVLTTHAPVIAQAAENSKGKYVKDVFIAYGYSEEEAVKWLTENDWVEYEKKRRRLSDVLRAIPNVRLLDAFSEGGGPKPEPGKLLLMPADGRSTDALAQELRERCGIEAELVLPSYVLLISTICDTPL